MSTLSALCLGLWLAAGADRADAETADSWRAAVVGAAQLSCLHGARADEIGLFACDPTCAPIPWQLDERDRRGELVLERGPLANPDSDGGAVDANDELVLMWSDASASRAKPTLPPSPTCWQAIELTVGNDRRTVVAARYAAPSAPRSPVRYVGYDEAADRMRGRFVELGFGAATPRWLSLRGGPAAGRNLLDRLKIRATARFFGIVPLGRDEDDILSVYEAWKAGPVRIVRRERKWVRLAFGFRTPYMNVETTFYRDFALLPVRLRLNYAPSQLLSKIVLRASLDFVNLEGWEVWSPGLREPSVVGGAQVPAVEVNEDPILTLRGGDTVLALALRLSESLRPLNVTLFYEEAARSDAPEAVAGQGPGVGFRLTDWRGVDRGHHWFVAESYSLRPGTVPESFAEARRLPMTVAIGPPQHGG